MGEGKVRDKNRKDSLELTKLCILDLYRIASSPTPSTHLSDILSPPLPTLNKLKSWRRSRWWSRRSWALLCPCTHQKYICMWTSSHWNNLKSAGRLCYNQGSRNIHMDSVGREKKQWGRNLHNRRGHRRGGGYTDSGILLGEQGVPATYWGLYPWHPAPGRWPLLAGLKSSGAYRRAVGNPKSACEEHMPACSWNKGQEAGWNCLGLWPVSHDHPCVLPACASPCPAPPTLVQLPARVKLLLPWREHSCAHPCLHLDRASAALVGGGIGCGVARALTCTLGPSQCSYPSLHWAPTLALLALAQLQLGVKVRLLGESTHLEGTEPAWMWPQGFCSRTLGLNSALIG